MKNGKRIRSGEFLLPVTEVKKRRYFIKVAYPPLRYT
jgi:hypothetical protein